ncbi:histidine phosphatase family protein [Magnetospira thiophila]
MKTLYLLRHAKSSWDNPMARDFDRPLSSRGRRAALAMAGFLAREELQPDLVLCSAACRARETLEQLQSTWNWTIPVWVEQDLYGYDSPALVTRLRRLSDDFDSVMVIGHNPTMETTARALVADGPPADRAAMQAKYPTAALAMIKFETPGATWSDIAAATGTLIRFVTPRDL